MSKENSAAIAAAVVVLILMGIIAKGNVSPSIHGPLVSGAFVVGGLILYYGSK